MALEVGQMAPQFTASTQSGDTVSLADQKGKIVVLYFYPKDDTPGCTTEACAFRDSRMDYEAEGAVVYGVSRDSVDSHQKFATKYGLTFPLLADPDGSICDAYDVIGEKMSFGKKTIGLIRTTYIIDAAGKIANVYPSVKVDGHAEEVLAAVRDLRASGGQR